MEALVVFKTRPVPPTPPMLIVLAFSGYFSENKHSFSSSTATEDVYSLAVFIRKSKL